MNQIPNHLIRTKDIIGRIVLNNENEELGFINEIVFNKLSGTIRYVVLSTGGFLGIGDKYFALPWDKFNYDTQLGVYVVDIDKAVLKTVPGFDKENWPTLNDDYWLSALAS